METAWLSSVFSVLETIVYLPIQSVLIMILSFLCCIIFILILEKLFSHFGDLGGECFWKIISLLQVKLLLLYLLSKTFGILEQLDL